jgi:hypothetical protein
MLCPVTGQVAITEKFYVLSRKHVIRVPHRYFVLFLFFPCEFFFSLFFLFPSTGLERPLGFQEVKAPEFLDNLHIKVVRLSALRTGPLYPQE